MTEIRVKANYQKKLRELRAYPEEPLNDVVSRLLNEYESKFGILKDKPPYARPWGKKE